MVRGPGISGPKKTVSVLMSLELHERLKKQAEQTSRSVSAYIRQVLKCYLWHMENEPEALVEHWKIS